MADFRMPSLGADMEHGKVVEWLVKPGDYINKGDLVAVVDTDKTVMDIESFEEGVVAEFLVEIGDTVEVGTPIARITATPAEVPQPPSGLPATDAGKPASRPVRGGRRGGEAAKVPPPVRHLAHTLGVDVGRISGTGPGGGVTRADVERAASARDTGAPRGKAAAPRPAQTVSAAAGTRRVRSSPLARRLANQLGIGIQALTGTGPDGAVTEADVQRAASAGGKAETLRNAIGSLMSRSKKRDSALLPLNHTGLSRRHGVDAVGQPAACAFVAAGSVCPAAESGSAGSEGGAGHERFLY